MTPSMRTALPTYGNRRPKLHLRGCSTSRASTFGTATVAYGQRKSLRVLDPASCSLPPSRAPLVPGMHRSWLNIDERWRCDQPGIAGNRRYLRVVTSAEAPPQLDCACLLKAHDNRIFFSAPNSSAKSSCQTRGFSRCSGDLIQPQFRNLRILRSATEFSSPPSFAEKSAKLLVAFKPEGPGPRVATLTGPGASDAARTARSGTYAWRCRHLRKRPFCQRGGAEQTAPPHRAAGPTKSC